jgi:hypothetical protein
MPKPNLTKTKTDYRSPGVKAQPPVTIKWKPAPGK